MLLIVTSGLSIYRPADNKGNFTEEYREVTKRFAKACKDYLGHEVMTLQDLGDYIQNQDFHKGDVLCLAYPLQQYRIFDNITIRLLQMINKLRISIIILVPTTMGLDRAYRYANNGEYIGIDTFEELLKIRSVSHG